VCIFALASQQSKEGVFLSLQWHISQPQTCDKPPSTMHPLCQLSFAANPEVKQPKHSTGLEFQWGIPHSQETPFPQLQRWHFKLGKARCRMQEMSRKVHSL
jgi:hypothetical protein